MGAKGSKHVHNNQCLANAKPSNECSNEICNCFLHDGHVKSKPAVSVLNQRWNWTKEHEAALQQSLHKNYQMSSQIADTLRPFAYSDDDSFHVPSYHVQQEPEYSSGIDLCEKSLCSRWYASHFEKCPTFDIAMVNTDQNMLGSLVSNLSSSSLPALQRDRGVDEGIRRVTFFVDSHLFTLNVQCAANVNAVAKTPHICVVLIRDERDIEKLGLLKSSSTDLCSLLSQRLILVQCPSCPITKQGYAAIRQFCNRYNVCYYKSDSAEFLDDEGGAQHLFALAIKHYWFKHCAV